MVSNAIGMKESPDKEFKGMIMAMIKQLKEDRNIKIDKIRKTRQDIKIQHWTGHHHGTG